MSNEKQNWKVAEVKVSYTPQKNQSIVIDSPAKAFEVLKRNWEEDLLFMQRQYGVLYLDKEQKPLGFRTAATGVEDHKNAPFNFIFTTALAIQADSIVVAHNNVNGTLWDRGKDEDFFDDLDFLSRVLNVKIFDHIVLCGDGFYSIRDIRADF